MELLKTSAILSSIVFSIIGVIVFWVSFIIIDKLTPYHLWQEIVEKRNTALAIIVAAMCLGIAIIVAAAIHG
jgi:putative membrane protein